jgi:Domain of unknown function (DUF397)
LTESGPGALGGQECDICAVDLPHASWRKSSRSGYNGSCVEVAELRSGVVGVRDTKDRGKGPVLVFGRDAWCGFLAKLKMDA